MIFLNFAAASNDVDKTRLPSTRFSTDFSHVSDRSWPKRYRPSIANVFHSVPYYRRHVRLNTLEEEARRPRARFLPPIALDPGRIWTLPLGSLAKPRYHRGYRVARVGSRFSIVDFWLGPSKRLLLQDHRRSSLIGLWSLVADSREICAKLGRCRDLQARMLRPRTFPKY